MRILTVLAGVILSFAGAFCYLFSTFSFSSLAFPVGAAMFFAGICIMASYLVSGRDNRLPDTVLVEGIVTLLFGFSVLNNQVTDAMLSMFFGSLTVISGATRISQSFAVSRYKPHDWAKVMVPSIVECILGFVMIMPTMVSAANSLILVGAALIIKGFSLLIYTMFMEKRTADEREAAAKARRAAKRAAAEEKKKEREYLMSLSKQERDAAIAEKKRRRRAVAAAKKEEKRIQRELERAERRPSKENTISFTKEESERIKDVARELGFVDDEDAPKAVPVQPEEPETVVPLVPVEAQLTPSVPEAPVEEEKWPSFQKPEAIPSLRKAVGPIAEEPEEDTFTPEPPVIKAVKLDELEESVPEVEFEAVELPKVEIASEGGEAWQRKKILKEIDQKNIKKETNPKGFVSLIHGELLTNKPKVSGKKTDEFADTFKVSWDADKIIAEASAEEGEKQ